MEGTPYTMRMEATVTVKNQPTTPLANPKPSITSLFVLQFDDSRWYVSQHEERNVLGVFLDRENAKKYGSTYLESRLEDRKKTEGGRKIEADLGLWGPVLIRPRRWETDVGASGVDKTCVSDGHNSIFVFVYAIPFYWN